MISPGTLPGSWTPSVGEDVSLVCREASVVCLFLASP